MHNPGIITNTVIHGNSVSGANPLTVTITDTSEAAPGTTMRYRWYLEGSGYNWGALSTITAKSFTYTYTSVGVHRIRHEVSNALNEGWQQASPNIDVTVT